MMLRSAHSLTRRSSSLVARSASARAFSTSSTDEFDLVVVGGGPGGYVAAIKAAQLGLKTACIESRGSLGGTCLNVGCIPSKALLHATHLYHQAQHDFSKYGIEVENVKMNFDGMMKSKEKAVKTLTMGIEGLFKKNKVTYIKGHGKIVAKNEVAVALNAGSNETVRAKNILIATGSEVSPLPPVPVDNAAGKIVDSTGALELKKVPEHLVVIGAGVIGLELGSVYSRIGAKVTVVEYLDRVCPGLDLELGKEFAKLLKKQGLKFEFQTKVTASQVVGDKVHLTVEPSAGGEPKTIEADTVLVATGRRPYTQGLGLEQMGIQTDKFGRIQVDDHFRTQIPNIFAIGDVIAGPMLAHKAEEEGIACVENIAGLHGHVNYNAIPGVIYTYPEVASVGKTEEQLKEEGVAYNVGKFPMMANSRARAVGESDGFVKVIADKATDRTEIYSMQWRHVDLGRNKVACAPFGGPIAVIRDDSKIVQLYAESALRKLRIFNSAGVQIAESVWKNPGGRLIGMTWTEDQILVCVTQDGSVYRYNIHAELIQDGAITMGRECFENSVVECVFWGNGMVCINEANQIFCIPDFKNPKPCQLANPNLEELPLCMAVIEPQYTMSGNVEVLLGVDDHVLLVEEDGVQQLGDGLGPLQKMVVSQNGKLLASFTHDGRLLVMSTDFSKIIFEYNCESALPPEQLAWCGMDSVLLYWDDMLLMVGPYGDPVRYVYDEPIMLIPECDGVRVLSNTSMEFLQRVPDSTVSIFKIGSTSPAALLYDALDHFDRRSAKADENLRLIRSSLPEAVEACIDAAGHEFDVSRQRTLLRAASYGQAFCSHFQRDRLQEMCKTLRVLNAIRNHDIGIPLSIQQYKLLTPSVLVGRLINAHKHLVALQISEYLSLNQEVIIMHWACAKITASLAIPDATLLDILLDKLKICKGISYAAVAAHADKNGRRKLAAMLVEHEPRSSKQVPLLLSIGEEDIALTKATESGDTDLVYLVLFHIWQKRPELEFFGMIQARPLARDLFIIYGRCYQHEFLKDFFLSTGQLQDVAFLLWKESWHLSKNPMASKGSPLHGPRIKLIEKAQSLFAETKEHVFESKAAEEHAKLLRIQHELEVQTKQPIFVDSSISDTIRTCIVLGNHRAAMRVRSEFKVSEKRWYWLKVFALATIRDWNALEKFSKEKRPPTGYRPFVEACVDADEKAEALKYIPKVADPRERAEAYARIGMAKEAADAASQAKDGELLGRLKMSFAQNAAASSLFDTLRDRLSFQGSL